VTTQQPNAAALLSNPWPVVKTKEQKLQEWIDAKALLDKAKAAEMTAREEVVSAFPFDADKLEGTQNIDLANGWKLKVVKKLNYKLDKTDDKTDKALEKIEKLGAEGVFIAERLVKWTPELSVSEYRKLDKKFKDIIDGVLTTTPGAPSLELIDPNAK
jgi:mRNA-degrading endonuclease HigB of HigAB toxin-antitoxin module